MLVTRRAPLASTLSLALVLTVFAAVLGPGCGAALQSNEIRYTLHDAPTLVKDNGTIIVNKRQVGQILADGKVVDTRGRPLAWLRESDIRLRGGVVLDIREDAEGTVRLSRSAQEKANLVPVTYEVRKDGTMATTKGSRGLPVKGVQTSKNRRLVLLLLVLERNGIWPDHASKQ